MEIQQIIDRLNTAWGEEHEKNRKKIFNDNVFRNPVVYFLGLSIIYFTPLIFCLPGLIFSPGKSDYLPIWIVEPWFNFPYYVFDLRASIIVSVASILLSLYVSVGKFADSAEGVTGEARRAAYRKFAKWVGHLVSAAFTLNFWDGLFAGYFQGTSRGPELFGGLTRSPEWGKLVVPSSMNLDRYGEMPLWVLIFFAWFTLASCLMLTYNEKDILVKNAYILTRMKKVASLGKESFVAEYEIAQCEYNAYSAKTLNGQKRQGKVQSDESNLSGYGDIFSLNREAIGFNVNIGQWPSVWILGFLKIIILWLFIVLFSLGFSAEKRAAFLVSVTLFMVVCFSMYLQYGRMNLFSVIYKFNSEIIKSDKNRFFNFWEFYYQRIFNALLVWSLTSISCLYPLNVIYRSFSGSDIGNDGPLSLYMYILVSLSVALFLIWFLEHSVKGVIQSVIEEHSKDKLSSKAKEIAAKNGKIDYILLSYIYCSMRNVTDMYSEYRSEIDVSEAEEEKQEVDASYLTLRVKLLNSSEGSI